MSEENTQPITNPNTFNRLGFDCTVDDISQIDIEKQSVTIALGDSGGDVVLPYIVFSECVRDSKEAETFVEKVLAAKEAEASNAQGPISKRQSVPPAE